jgi:hypothetical protein
MIFYVLQVAFRKNLGELCHRLQEGLLICSGIIKGTNGHMKVVRAFRPPSERLLRGLPVASSTA